MNETYIVVGKSNPVIKESGEVIDTGFYARMAGLVNEIHVGKTPGQAINRLLDSETHDIRKIVACLQGVKMPDELPEGNQYTLMPCPACNQVNLTEKPATAELYHPLDKEDTACEAIVLQCTRCWAQVAIPKDAWENDMAKGRIQATE